MFYHPITKKELEFNSKDELIQFLQKLNPSMMKNFASQYKEKYPNYEIIDFGLKVEIRKIKNK